jgi:hypothetical protein
MKWYWAILVTVAIMIAVGMLPEQAAEGAAALVAAISAIAIAAHSRSWGWGIFVLFLWPIAFPCYMIALVAETSAPDRCFTSKSGQHSESFDREAQFIGKNRIFTAEVPHENEPSREPARTPPVGLLILVGLVIVLVVLGVLFKAVIDGRSHQPKGPGKSTPQGTESQDAAAIVSQSHLYSEKSQNTTLCETLPRVVPAGRNSLSGSHAG